MKTLGKVIINHNH